MERGVRPIVDVQEASVLGVADLAYWKYRLGQADLVLAERKGREVCKCQVP
jgi:hypothetical protein